MNARWTFRAQITRQLGITIKPLSIFNGPLPPKRGLSCEVSLWHRRLVLQLTQK